MGGGLHRGDERRTGNIATEPTEFLGRNDDDLVTSVDCHVLWPLVSNAADQLTEARLGVLQRPVGGLPRAGTTCRFSSRRA